MNGGRVKDGMTDRCEHPTYEPGEPRSYLAYGAWAEEKIKTHHQEFCPHCKRWRIWVPGPPKADA